MDPTMTGAGTDWYLAETVFAAERSGTWKAELAFVPRHRPAERQCDCDATSSIAGRTDLFEPKYRVEQIPP